MVVERLERALFSGWSEQEEEEMASSSEHSKKGRLELEGDQRQYN